MVKGLWGKKIGMTQIFSENGVVPVTVIDVANWFITQVKTKDRDGYNAVQIGRVKDKYAQQAFSADWLKKPNEYFSVMREVHLGEEAGNFTVGEPANFITSINTGEMVDVTGITKGCGFAGVVRRHDFNGPPASHGSTMGKRTGSLSFMRSRGRVIKGKRMPGHMGVDQQVMQGLEVIKVEPETQIVAVKGSVPGKAGSLVFIEKA
ncbi:MAG TPA: 50S ribosomal protein L3 [Candidatus Babeliales bacterium]|nr:50S ribosomal protein L3 [Candidatus Babeliales bacterium]